VPFFIKPYVRMFQDTILTSKLSSKILSFLTVGDQITHLYTTTGKVTVSYTLMQSLGSYLTSCLLWFCLTTVYIRPFPERMSVLKTFTVNKTRMKWTSHDKEGIRIGKEFVKGDERITEVNTVVSKEYCLRVRDAMQFGTIYQPT
jgi:hypothetical protein